MLWDLALKNLWRRKLRTLLTILGVASAVQLYLMVHGIMTTYTNEIEGQISSFTGKLIIQQQTEEGEGTTDLTSSGSSLTAETAESLLTLDGIDRQSSSAMLFVPIARAIMPYVPPAVIGVGIEPGREEAFLGGFEAESGSLTLHGADEAILGQSALDYYQPKDGGIPIAVGEKIEVGGRMLTVVGILKSAPQLFANSVIMPLETAQQIFDRVGTVSSVILTAAKVENIVEIKETVVSRQSDLQVSTQDDMLRSAQGVLSGIGTFMGLVENSIIVVAILVVTIVVVVAVMEGRREIGTLRAVGAKRWRIFAMVAGQSVLLSLLGAMIALPIALFFVQWGMQENLTTIRGIFQVWLQTLLTAVVVGLTASILPAWQAVRVDPLESLRYE